VGVRVGTSGWSYDDWASRFYAGVPRKAWLRHYAQTFPTVEINNTFYRLPAPSAVAGWRDQTPPGFRIVAKGSRYLTHMKRLTDSGPGVRRFFERLEPLGDRLDTVLWQLPPTMSIDLERLDTFLGALPTTVRHAVEFRHRSWQQREASVVLDRHHALTVAVSGPQLPADHTMTGGAVYVRFHGLRAGYAYDYTDDDLRPWAEWLRHRRDGFAFFNNDVGGHAVKNALQLCELLR
jgi:uncharacterized protein YecE (DUF72 family)